MASLTEMEILYNIFIRLYGFAIYLSSFYNPKAKLWINGRKNQTNPICKLANLKQKKIWVHCASLGEFEQARPLLELLKQEIDEVYLVLTFFSPSGYEVRKNYPLADWVGYLPLDTPRNAHNFVTALNPSIAIFTKYDIWHNYLKQLSNLKIPSVLFSANFRHNQHYFSWYGRFFQSSLWYLTKIFVQNNASQGLLKRVSIDSEIAFDTRFDRVSKIVKEPKKFELLSGFVKQNRVLVAGSTWPADELVILGIWPKLKKMGYKLIIAPHDVNDVRVNDISSLFCQPTTLFSKLKNDIDTSIDIIIVDTIGDLTSIYQYAHIVYVGGGFNKSIHNILEPAAYGLPVIFGPNHKKSQEAQELLRLGGAKSIANSQELYLYISSLNSAKENTIRNLNLNYIKSNLGGTAVVFNYVARTLRP